MEMDEAITKALEGRAILFTGAGFSSGAEGPRGTLKRGSDLLDHFVALTGLSKEDGLESVAEAYVEQNGRDALIREIHEEFTTRAVTSGQKTIARVPWRRVYTTNYDDVYEAASAQGGQTIFSVSLSVQPAGVPKGPRDPTVIVHLNGSVRLMTRDNVLSEIKLTDSSYLSSIEESPWLSLFRQDVSLARAVFFVGYSLYDIDVRRILARDEALRSKAFFIVGVDPNPAVARRVERFGAVLTVDVESFANQIAAISRDYTPTGIGPLPYCLEQFNPVAPPRALEDRFVFDLLLYGDVQGDFVWKGLHGNEPYVIGRQIAEQTMAVFKDGARLVALHSGLGNGKSICLEILKVLAFDQDYSVYAVRRHGASLLEELEQALKNERRLLFIVDDYADWHDFLEVLAHRMSENVTLVVAARNLTHDVQVDYLEDRFGEVVIHEVPVDRLTAADAIAVAAYLDLYGLWGDKTGWSSDRKVSFIQSVCKAEWHAVLLDVLESPQIIRRLETLFEEVRPGGIYYDAILIVLILAVLQYAPTVNNLIDVCGRQVLDAGFQLNPVVAELVDFDRGEVRLKSSVAARFMLKRIAGPNAVVDQLIALLRRVDGYATVSTEMLSLAQKLMRFGALSATLPEEHGARAAIRVYESVKDLSICRNKPLFWLQYAIAALVAGERERAGRYFQAAYAHARNLTGYNTYQIDNHYARYLLQEAAAAADPSEVMPYVREARKILVRELAGNERLQYPFRVATELAQIFDLQAGLSADEQREIRQIARFVLDRINGLSEERRAVRYAEDCARAMRHILRSEPL